MVKPLALTVATFLSLFASVPSSTNFTLKAFDFGNGGGSGSSSSYKLNGSTGTQSGTLQTSGEYGLKSGEQPTQDANVPPAATLSNPDNTYNKLRLILNTGGNPTDTRYAIAISNDDFVTISYVQNDRSLGPSLGIEDHQTYAQWGGATGFDLLGLIANTPYKVRVSALQGDFTGSAFGPASASVTTAQPSISFSVSTNASSTPPYGISFTILTPNTVFSANTEAVVTVTSNAEFGGGIYVRNTNDGLLSPTNNYKLPSTNADLSLSQIGYGAQVTSVSTTNGAPFTSAAPYNGTANIVGALATSLQLVASSPSPIVNGNTVMAFKAKTTTTTPAAEDYTDRLTFMAVMLF